MPKLSDPVRIVEGEEVVSPTHPLDVTLGGTPIVVPSPLLIQLVSEETARNVELMQGEIITLFASASRGAGVDVLGTAVPINGERLIYTWLLDVTATLTDATDTFDCYIDTLIGVTWINIAHFTQVLGNDGATAIFTVTVPANMTTTELTTTDCAAGVSRGIVGSQFRGRYTIVNGNAADFTFSLIGYAL